MHQQEIYAEICEAWPLIYKGLWIYILNIYIYNLIYIYIHIFCNVLMVPLRQSPVKGLKYVLSPLSQIKKLNESLIASIIFPLFDSCIQHDSTSNSQSGSGHKTHVHHQCRKRRCQDRPGSVMKTPEIWQDKIDIPGA